MSSTNKISIRSAGLFIILILFAALLTTFYLSNERFFYFWDPAFYMSNAISISKLFVQNPLVALKTIYLSTSTEYNSYYVLPLIPFLWIFKYSRLGYILGIVFTYFIPLFIVTGWIAKRIFPTSTHIYWITTFVGTSIPVLWASVLQGFPDMGAVLFLAVAILIYLQDMELKQWQWQWQLPMIGIFSAFAVVFRRPFAYDAIALFISIGTMSFIFSFPQCKGEGDWKKIFTKFLEYVVIKLGITLAFFILAVVLFDPPFMFKIVGTNYLTLYASYALPPVQVAIYFFRAYGILCVLAFIGLIAATYKQWNESQIHKGNSITKAPLLFIIIFGIVSFSLWILIPRQASVHYTLHVALPIILGVSCIALEIGILKPRFRWTATVLFTSLLAANLWLGLAPTRLIPITWAFSIRFPPQQREDYDEVVRLIAYLRQITNEGDEIYVVDSSELMNNELIYYAENSLYKGNTKLTVLQSPQVDSRDYYPLEPLLQADYVIVTTPFQYHLSMGQQKVVEFVFDAFSQNWPIAQDYTRLPEQFHLANGANLSIYKRQRPTSFETILLTFDQMKNYINRWPGSQDDWIPILDNTNLQISKIQNQRYSLTLTPNATSPETQASLLFARPLPLSGSVQGSVRFLGKECSQIRIALQQFQPTGLMTTENTKIISSDSATFNITFQTMDSANSLMILDMKTLPKPSCPYVMDWDWQADK